MPVTGFRQVSFNLGYPVLLSRVGIQPELSFPTPTTSHQPERPILGFPPSLRVVRGGIFGAFLSVVTRFPWKPRKCEAISGRELSAQQAGFAIWRASYLPCRWCTCQPRLFGWGQHNPRLVGHRQSCKMGGFERDLHRPILFRPPPPAALVLLSACRGRDLRIRICFGLQHPFELSRCCAALEPPSPVDPCG